MNPAFAYLYDEFLSDRRFERDLALIETEVSRRGIEGRIVRLTLFRQAHDLIKDLARGPVKNLIFVGNDETLKKMAWFLPDLDLTVGYIPLVQPSPIASLLGIPVGVGAVDVVAARLVETFDVGKLNDRPFLFEVVVPRSDVAVDIEGRYRIRPTKDGSIAIRNLGGGAEPNALCANPEDGFLEAIVQAQLRAGGLSSLWRRPELSESRIYFQHGKLIADKPAEIFVDGESMKGKEFVLSIMPKKMRWITGKQKGWETLVRNKNS